MLDLELASRITIITNRALCGGEAALLARSLPRESLGIARGRSGAALGRLDRRGRESTVEKRIRAGRDELPQLSVGGLGPEDMTSSADRPRIVGDLQNSHPQ